MVIVHVFIHVKPDCIDAFKNVTSDNARNSIQEKGVARFDVIQQQDDPARFVLMEAYRSVAATSDHKQTSHYKLWRDTVEAMMAEPRKSNRYTNVFPDDAAW